MSTPSAVIQGTRAKPKLVRIIARLNVGGPARQACLLHERLTPSFDCCLIVGELAAEEQDMSYLLSSERNVIRLPLMSREVRWWADARAFWKILKFLRTERPDVVHTHTAKAGALGRAAAWLAGIPVIVHTYHGHIFDAYFSTWQTRFYMAIERALGHLTTRVIAVSASQAEEIGCKHQIVPTEKISVVHNGFDLGRFSNETSVEARKVLGIEESDFVAAWVGRMVPVKGVTLLRDVILKATQSHSRICFLVVGDGPERSKLSGLADAGANIRCLGWRRDVETVWAAADVAILTSLNEGTPTSLIEGMAAGTPFVATNVGGTRDLALGPLHNLPEGMGLQAKNGFLTPRTPEALLYCIQQLQRDPAMKRQMGAVGKAFVLQQFATQRLTTDMCSLYHNLMQKKGRFATISDKQSAEDPSRAVDAL